MGEEARIAPMRVVARPSAALLSRTSIMYPERGVPRSKRIAGILDDIVAVDALAFCLTEAFEKKMDQRETGAHVIRCMIQDGGAVRPRLGGPPIDPNVEAMAVDMAAADALGRLVFEAIDKTQEKGTGLTDTRKVAVFVFRAINGIRGER